MKIYCILFDTMPMVPELVRFGDSRGMKKLHQVGGCFTMTSMIEMFTGEMPSDLQKKGVGHRGLEKYRDGFSKKINVPWYNKLITSKLSDNGWDIHLHNVPPDNFILGDIYSDSYPGGYENRYDKVKGRTGKKIGSDVMMNDILLGDSKEATDWQEREVEFIYSIQKQKPETNTFYFIEYEHFHSLNSRISRRKKKRLAMEKYRQVSLRRTMQLINEWDTKEPNSIFWFFGDHGYPSLNMRVPQVDSYLSWVLFKDNAKQRSINPVSNVISIRDFSPTILDKLGYSYDKIGETCSIQDLVDKDRVYFVEDGRLKFNKKKSTSAIACKVVKWKDDLPRKILQVGYFINKRRFYYSLNILDKDGFFKKSTELEISDKIYRSELLYLKEKVKKRFIWIGKEEYE